MTNAKEKQLPALVSSDRATLTSTPVMTAQETQARLEVFRGFVAQNLHKGEHYGVIPGTDKKTLLKPGAELICEFYGWYPDIEFLTFVENWDKEPPLFDYTVKLTLLSKIDDRKIGVGVGSCNSYEGRYRWRNADRACPQCEFRGAICKSKFPDKNTGDKGFYCFDKKGGCGATFHSTDKSITDQKLGRVPNDDIAALKNTVLKMAKKRALVDAAISCSRSSAIFTQDVEDFADSNVDLVAEVKDVTDVEYGPPDSNGEVKPVTPKQQSKSQVGGKTAAAGGQTGKPQSGAQKSQETATSASQGAETAPTAGSTPTPTTSLIKLEGIAHEFAALVNSGIVDGDPVFDLATHGPKLREAFGAMFGGVDTGRKVLNHYLMNVSEPRIGKDNAHETTWEICKGAIQWARNPANTQPLISG